MSLSFRRVGPDDLALLNAWLGRSHVAEWWDADPFDADDLADEQTRMWLVTLDGRPFAYAQDYAVHGFGPHPFDYLPVGARGIDQFIGEAELVGHGHGTALVQAMCTRLFAEGAPAVGVDPHPENARAIAAYRRAGFVDTGVVRETAWGRVALMEAWRPDALRPLPRP